MSGKAKTITMSVSEETHAHLKRMSDDTAIPISILARMYMLRGIKADSEKVQDLC